MLNEMPLMERKTIIENPNGSNNDKSQAAFCGLAFTITDP